eukprot:gb/GFBE01040771.1/.p1 GENE.gb/GFBE01040771.1/~~gb/GFBE01040771.1/.p1  ORF type:complete len:874 (+),score=169.36 gb/GFBE01040771.1/:1-2622(+)
MPSIKAPAFFGKFRKQSTTQQAPAAGAVPDAQATSKGASDALSKLCLSSHSPALFRSLGGTVSLICNALTVGPAPGPAESALGAAAEFLSCGESPEQFLQFALIVHTDKVATSRFFTDLEGAITMICQSPAHRMSAASLEEALCQLTSDMEVFCQRCKEMWELHFYFTFLDVKGDKALLMPVAKTLQGHLETSVRGLMANLSHTRSWVESAFANLAGQEQAAVLEQRHGASLQQWIVAAKETATANLKDKDPNQFWETLFSNLLKTTWPDFADGFQEFFIKALVPQDILECLRKRLVSSETCRHHVTLSNWQTMMKEFKDINALLDSLLKEVMDDLRSAIYVEGKRIVVAGGGAISPITRGSSRASTCTSTGFLSGSGAKSADLGLRAAGKGDEKPSTPVSMAPPGVAISDVLPPSRSSEASRDSTNAATPQDARFRHAPLQPGAKVDWDTYVDQLCSTEKAWWLTADSRDQSSPEQENLRAQAISSVRSSLACTRRSLVLRVASGDLAQNRPQLSIPGTENTNSGRLPAIVIGPNGMSLDKVTKFGRGSNRRMMLPDLVMNEPIASRSHFNILYEPETNRYQLMDAGSKWGTFMKVGTSGHRISCGDWIRIGNAELVVRYCGGSCGSHRRHAHHKLHSLSVARNACSGGNFFAGARPYAPLQWQRLLASDNTPEEELEDPDQHEEMLAKVSVMLGGHAPKAWASSFDLMCNHAEAGKTPEGEKTRINPSSGRPGERKPPLCLPVVPLEIDFISGPRMGERLMVTDRVCTIGRGESSTIQLNDSMLANVSRTHSILENRGNGWYIRDNKSTNGTWRRLSCVLEPSKPKDLSTGDSFLAGVHEIHVEEADMNRLWIPSPATQSLRTLAAMEAQM